MTVSGTTAFELTVEQIVKEARSTLGIHDAEEPMQAHELDQGILALNMMLRTWEADGVKTWTLAEGSFDLTQGVYSYAIGAGGVFTTVPLEITDVRISRSNRDLPMWRLSREEYLAFPIKDNQGYPTQFYYDRQRAGGTFYVWPSPDSLVGTIKFTYRRRLMDAGVGPSTLDIPVEWTQAVVYNLAKFLIPNYSGVKGESLAFVMKEADRTYAIVKDFDIGEGKGSITITPWGDF